MRFGNRWVESSVTELFEEDVAEFRALLAQDIEENPLECLDAGQVPRLGATGSAWVARSLSCMKGQGSRAERLAALTAATVDAIDLMRKHGVSFLPVVKNDKLVGLVTERDFMPIAYQLLDDKLAE